MPRVPAAGGVARGGGAGQAGRVRRRDVLGAAGARASGIRTRPCSCSGSRRRRTAATAPVGYSPATAPATGCSVRCTGSGWPTRPSRSPSTTAWRCTAAGWRRRSAARPRRTSRPRPSVTPACPTRCASSSCWPGVRVIVCLGAFAWDAALRILAAGGSTVPRPRPKFGHGAEVTVGDRVLLGCYHPSQQNTFTGKLTRPMIDDVMRRARELGGVADPAVKLRAAWAPAVTLAFSALLVIADREWRVPAFGGAGVACELEPGGRWIPGRCGWRRHPRRRPRASARCVPRAASPARRCASRAVYRSHARSAEGDVGGVVPGGTDRRPPGRRQGLQRLVGGTDAVDRARGPRRDQARQSSARADQPAFPRSRDLAGRAC